MNFAAVYVECGLGPLRICQYITDQLTSHGHCCQLIALEPLLPTPLRRLLFDTYKHWCLVGARTHSHLFTSRRIYRLLYAGLRTIAPCYIQRLARHPVLSRADVVIAGSYYPAFFASLARRTLGRRLPIVGVLVDHVPSPGWVLPIDAICVANTCSRDRLIAYGAHSTSVHCTGIPLPSHTPPPSAAINREPQELLLSGGGWGLGPLLDITSALLASESSYPLHVICGDNTQARDALTQRFCSACAAGTLRVSGLVSSMHPLYQRAALFFTKAGGVSLTEAAYYGVPIVITSMLPGHEEGNARVFAAADACVVLTHPSDAARVSKTLLADRSRCKSLTRNARRLITHDSTRRVLDVIATVSYNVD